MRMCGSESVDRVGVLGGGQLGRMMSFPAHRLGLSLTFLDPAGELSPAGQTANSDRSIKGSFRDAGSVKKLSERVDIITAEIEHVNTSILEKIELEQGAVVQPCSATISLIQDKFQQKVFFQKHGIPMARFMEVKCMDDVKKAVEEFGSGYPIMLKNKRLAYDGKGNALITCESDIETSFKTLYENGGQEGGMYVEEFYNFVAEIAVLVFQSRDGSIGSYPMVETIQKNSICHMTLYPIRHECAKEVELKAKELAQKIVSCLTGAGVFGVELFLSKNGDIVFNEIAPRPHNSAHYTIEACVTDQFEQHLRAITGISLGDPSLKVPAVCMMNVLGDGTGSCLILKERMRNSLKIPGCSMHWYGKEENKTGRKMGHLTIIADNPKHLYQKIEAVEFILSGN